MTSSAYPSAELHAAERHGLRRAATQGGAGLQGAGPARVARACWKARASRRTRSSPGSRSRDVEASLAQARAQVKVAQANLAAAGRRTEKRRTQPAPLRDSGAERRHAGDAVRRRPGALRQGAGRRSSNSRAAIVSAQANARAAAQVAVDQTVIRAPFNGVVIEKHANVGDNITPFSQASDSKGRGRDHRRHGHPRSRGGCRGVEHRQDRRRRSLARSSSTRCPNCVSRASVSRIVPTVDRSKATVLVKVRFVDRDPRVLPDMSAQDRFPVQSRCRPQDRRPVVAAQPAADRRARRTQRRLAVVEDETVHQVPVTTGAKLGDLIARRRRARRRRCWCVRRTRS